jgi:hypothetical protein
MGIIIPSFYEYSLTPEEEATVARIGYERQLPMFAQPERNRNYYEGEIWEMWQHGVCAGAELAFARMCGLEDFVPHVNKFKTVSDVSGWEVRYSFGNNMLRFSEWDDPEACYVLLTEGLRHRTRRTKEQNWLGVPYRAVAWAYGHEISAKGEKIGKSWRLHRNRAHKMLELQQHSPSIV